MALIKKLQNIQKAVIIFADYFLSISSRPQRIFYLENFFDRQ